MSGRVLFVAPALPSPSRSGLRMRCWLFLRGLSRDHRVTVVAGSPAFPDEALEDLRAVSGLAEETIVLPFQSRNDLFLLARRIVAKCGMPRTPSWDWAAPTPLLRRRLARVEGSTFDLVHVSRLYMLPVALAILPRHNPPPLQLDLDDWESRTRARIAVLMAQRDPARARRLTREATHLEKEERHWLRLLQRVFACSDADAKALAAQYGLGNLAVQENAVNVPRVRPEPPAAPLAFLFIGALGYYPNEDAVWFLLDEVLPALRATGCEDFLLLVAGGGARPALRLRMAVEDHVSYVEAPPSVEPLYVRAHVALVPIRAGGGTRVKILEAFAQGRPVVATFAAVEGLNVEPEVHYLLAETPVEWALAITRLIADGELAARLAATAFAWVRERSLDVAAETIAAALRVAGRPPVTAGELPIP